MEGNLSQTKKNGNCQPVMANWSHAVCGFEGGGPPHWGLIRNQNGRLGGSR